MRGRKSRVDTSWAEVQNCCKHCRKEDIQADFGPRTFIICACCQVI